MRMVLLMIILAFGFSTRLLGQDTTKVEQYCELLAFSKLLSRKVTVQMDFGQQIKFFSTKNTRILDNSDKPRVFNSVMDALNYMGIRGWVLVNAFPVTVGNQNIYHYVMKRNSTAAELEQFKRELEDMINKAEVEK